MKKKILSCVLSLCLLLSLGVTALAAQHTEYPVGGTWNWGERYESGTKYAYSEYWLTANDDLNTNGKHRTSVIGRSTSKTIWIDPGKWANSKIICKAFVRERCYYSLQDRNGNERS